MSYLFVSLIFDLLGYAASSIFLGLLFSAIILGLLFIFIKGICSKHTFTPLSFIVGALFSVLLFFQLVFICGAFKVKGMTSDVETTLHRLTAGSEETVLKDGHQVAAQLKMEYPLLEHYVDLIEFQGNQVNSVSNYIEEIQRVLNKYILRRIGWSLFFIVLGTFIVIKTMEVYCKTATPGRKRTIMRSNRRGRGFR